MNSLFLLAALAGPNDAVAAKGPKMWGVGPSISTQVFPPSIPNSRSKFDNWKDDMENTAVGEAYADENGKLQEGKYPGVQGDFQLGAKAMVYFNDEWRMGVRPNFGMGKNFSSWNVNLEIDKILISSGGMNAFMGGGLGMGRMKFTSAEEDDSYYNLGNYIARIHAGGYYAFKKQAVELSLYAKFPFAYRQVLHVGEEEYGLNSGFNPVQYFAMGLELSVYFGDFVMKNPKKKKRGKKKGRR
jgi:hypothetical protein